MAPETERGSALMLMPAAVLVMVVLGAFAVDGALVFLGEREVANLAAGVANDIAGAALDREVFYDPEDGRVALDAERAEEVLGLALAAYQPEYLANVAALELDVTGDDQVTVTIGATVDYLFAAALPGSADGVAVSATATATAQQE